MLGRETHALDAEIIEAERAKSVILAVTMLGLAVVAAIALNSPEGQARFAEEWMGGILSPALMVGLAVYELLWRELLGRMPVERRHLLHGLALLNTCIEVSAPTLMLLIIASGATPSYALGSPPTYFYALFITLSALHLYPPVSVVGGLVAALQYVGLMVAWDVADFGTAGVASALLGLGLATGGVAQQIRLRVERILTSAHERDRVERVFGRYLSDDVVEELLHNPDGLDLGGERREITVLMNDLRGFSTLSAGLPPEEVVRVLNRFLGVMTDVVMDHGGTIDEIIGDALLVIFGAPKPMDDAADRAIACAIAMQRAMPGVNAWCRDQGLPELEMGVAVNTGELVVGNIGSERRSKYGVVGPAINLTARIEGTSVGGQVLAAERTVECATSALQIGSERSLAAKGASEPVRVFELLGIGGPWNLALEHYSDPRYLMAEPVPIELRRVVDKAVSGTGVMVSLVAMGERTMELQGAPELPLHKEVALELPGEGGGEPARAFAKVVAVSGGVTRLRITALTQGADVAWARLGDGATGALTEAEGAAVPQA